MERFQLSDSNRNVTSGRQRRARVASLLPASVVSRTVAVVSALAIVTMVVGAACVGGDSSTPTPFYVIETFTPTPPDHTPEALITRAAQQTASAQTATAQPTRDPSAPTPLPGTPGATRTIPSGSEIRPPDLILRTSFGETWAAVGSFNWCSVALGTCADIQTGYIILETDTLFWAIGDEGTIEVPDTPFPALSAEVGLYLHDQNVVIPQDVTGQIIGDKPAFVPLIAPAQFETVTGAGGWSFTPDVPPGKYILSVNISWTQPEGAPLPLHTEYAFIVEVF